MRNEKRQGLGFVKENKGKCDATKQNKKNYFIVLDY